MRYCMVCVILCLPGTTWPTQTAYEASLRQSAGVTIDGDLSDWSRLDLGRRPITEASSGHLISSPEDLSASFSCLVDANNLYIAVWVTDDELIFGTESFHEGANDDAVDIFLDGDLADIEKEYFDENDGHIRIVRGKDGRVHLEGSSGIFWLSRLSRMPNEIEMTVEESGEIIERHLRDILFPYSWELLGVEAASSDTQDGYVVEIRIPAEILQIEEFVPGLQMGLDFRVLDDDDGDGLDAYVDWSPQGPPKNLSFRTTYYGRLLVVAGDASLSTRFNDLQSTVAVTDHNEVELTLGSHPDTPASAWREHMRGDWYDLQSHLLDLASSASDIESRSFANFLLARMAWKRSDLQTSMDHIQWIVSSEPLADPLRLYGLKTLAAMHEDAGDFYRAEEALLQASQYDRRNSLAMQLAEFYERTSDYSKAATTYKKIVASVPSDERLHHTAAFKIGLCCRYLGEHELAREQFLWCQTKFGEDDGNYWSWMEYQLGSVALAEGNYTEALGKFESVLSSRRSDNNQNVYRFAEIAIAQTHLLIGNRDKGHEFLHRIIEDHPGTEVERDAHELLTKFSN